MKPFPIKALAFAFVFASHTSVFFGRLKADTVQVVSNFSELTAAIANANSYSGGFYTIEFSADIAAPVSEGSLQQFINMQSGASLLIDGKGYSLDMNLQDRAFYVAQGTVSFASLTIEEGYAKGGDGGAGGGGGLGAGGAIYVASRGGGTHVSVSNVTLSNNVSQGGGGGYSTSTSNAAQGGGGGGMGGNGGDGFFESGSIVTNNHDGSGGGGGFGQGADGGTTLKDSASPGSAGAYVGGDSGGNGDGNNISALGGSNGGGGGGAESSTFVGTPQTAAGGGGVGGGAGVRDSTNTRGGAGGYGGGGGGARNHGGAGGFGGGGGAGMESGHTASNEFYGGNGGFGGGGGTGSYLTENTAGAGGFGGGNAVNTSRTNHTGGGGMGAGGAIFTEKGATLLLSEVSFVDNSAVGGGSLDDLSNGIALGANLFLGTNVTYQVATGTAELSGLGGGGDASDSRVAGRDTNGEAQGGLIKTGAGRLRLSGENTYGGATQVREGKLTLDVTKIFTSGYEVSSGATLEVATNGLKPAAITTESGAEVLVSASSVDLSNTTFTVGTVIIDGSASGLNATGSALRVGGSGTLQSFSDVATFVPASLTLQNTTWQNGTIFEFNLSETAFTSTGTSDFSHVGDGQLQITILTLGSELQAGDKVALMTFADASSFTLGKFSFTSGVDGFSGSLYQQSSGGILTLGVEIVAVPEPSAGLMLLFGTVALYVLRRRA